MSDLRAGERGFRPKNLAETERQLIDIGLGAYRRWRESGGNGSGFHFVVNPFSVVDPMPYSGGPVPRKFSPTATLTLRAVSVVEIAPFPGQNANPMWLHLIEFDGQRLYFTLDPIRGWEEATKQKEPTE